MQSRTETAKEIVSPQEIVPGSVEVVLSMTAAAYVAGTIAPARAAWMLARATTTNAQKSPTHACVNSPSRATIVSLCAKRARTAAASAEAFAP